VTRASFQTSYGHEAINRVGGEFIPDLSNQLVIRVPLDGKIGDRIELDRKTAWKSWPNWSSLAMFMRKA